MCDWGGRPLREKERSFLLENKRALSSRKSVERRDFTEMIITKEEEKGLHRELEYGSPLLRPIGFFFIFLLVSTPCDYMILLLFLTMKKGNGGLSHTHPREDSEEVEAGEINYIYIYIYIYITNRRREKQKQEQQHGGYSERRSPWLLLLSARMFRRILFCFVCLLLFFVFVFFLARPFLLFLSITPTYFRRGWGWIYFIFSRFFAPVFVYISLFLVHLSCRTDTKKKKTNTFHMDIVHGVEQQRAVSSQRTTRTHTARCEISPYAYEMICSFQMAAGALPEYSPSEQPTHSRERERRAHTPQRHLHPLFFCSVCVMEAKAERERENSFGPSRAQDIIIILLRHIFLAFHLSSYASPFPIQPNSFSPVVLQKKNERKEGRGGILDASSVNCFHPIHRVAYPPPTPPPFFFFLF
eukprot:gene8044-5597_t